MDPLNQRILLVVRKTRLEDLVVRFNTVEQARFYIEHLGADFGDYELEHRTYQQAVRSAEEALRRFGRVDLDLQSAIDAQATAIGRGDPFGLAVLGDGAACTCHAAVFGQTDHKRRV